MTVLEAYNYVASLVDDRSFGYFTKDQLLIFLNQSVQECQKKLIASGNNWYLKVTPDSGVGSYTTTANQATYTPPTDMMNINRIEIVQNPGVNENRTNLTSITLNQKDFFYGYSQWPVAFYFQKSDIVMCPAPQQSGLLIRYFYTYRIAALVNESDEIDVPNEFEEYVCYLTTLKCFQKDGRDASLILRYTDDVEKRLEKQAIQRAQDRAPSIVMTGDNVSGWGFY